MTKKSDTLADVALFGEENQNKNEQRQNNTGGVPETYQDDTASYAAAMAYFGGDVQKISRTVI